MADIPLIVFEGVDNSGKTTISKKVAEMLPGVTWSKEPVFTTEMADRLNSKTSILSDAGREVLFLEGRLQQQKLYRSTPCLLDRYLWTGMSYAKAFSPSIYDFCVELYQNYNIFKKPTLTFFMETPLDICRSREPDNAELTIERLTKIRQAYADTQRFVNTDIIFLDGTKSIDELVTTVYNDIKDIAGIAHV